MITFIIGEQYMYFEQLNPDDCMSYMIFDEKKKSAVIIDPKLDYVDFYLNLLEEKDGKLIMVIDTHTHADHLSGAPLLVEKTNCTYAMHKNTEVSCVTLRVKDNDKIAIEDIELKVIYTPGHTNDAICLIFEDKIFTGDFLFLDEGGGRNDLPTGDMDKHWKSLKKVKKLPDYLIVCPGHNYTEASVSTLWLQKQKNPYFKFKCRDDFKKYLNKNKPAEPPKWLFDVVNANKMCNKDLSAVEIPSLDAVCQSAVKRYRQPLLFITPEQLKEKINKNEDIVILDVRTQKELINGYPLLEGSINIPLGQLSSSLDKLDKYKEKEIIIICRRGFKSRMASKLLTKAGFKKVYILKGGISSY
ncbi:MBL fold metallo-hydrolase [Oceanirhabdus sp. W0125-5]|uniref:MBL fold metallo-hydrolase n=1 Tax=Oceanirhabdus sp. W0125-5 TaxID=2999116 RepID=UPI0022F319DC|nr:MBL fold metallo-hydrolase [Oceanirhabdus sp. W0125-5]WBW98987.1 MBL fold metallo-hydrolase [Oceanirhabdus sp. W0125-5]